MGLHLFQISAVRLLGTNDHSDHCMRHQLLLTLPSEWIVGQHAHLWMHEAIQQVELVGVGEGSLQQPDAIAPLRVECHVGVQDGLLQEPDARW